MCAAIGGQMEPRWQGRMTVRGVRDDGVVDEWLTGLYEQVRSEPAEQGGVGELEHYAKG